MKNSIELLEGLYNKAINIYDHFGALPEKDIRRKHFEILASQVAVSLSNLKINMKYAAAHEKEFEELFGGDKNMADNYIHNFTQNIQESIIEAAVFQTELVLRFLYAKLTGTDVGAEKNFHRIVAILFEDVENNWAKEESKLIILLWTFRNTIHTGGIYFQKQAGDTIKYKGKDYVFEYGKAPAFQADGHNLELISDLLDAIKYSFETTTTKGIPYFDHPAYDALGL